MGNPYNESGGSQILRGCGLLLLSLTCVSCVPVFLLYNAFVVPILENVNLDNLSPASKRANKYVISGDGWPIPEDVEIGESLESFAKSRGFDEYLGEYYQITGTIAAAENWDIRPVDLLTMMWIEGGWTGAVPAYTYVRATETAQFLSFFGYSRMNLMLRDAAILAYGGAGYLDLFLQERGAWSAVAGDVEIKPRGKLDFARWPGLVEYHLLLENLGYRERINIGGVWVILTDPGTIPPNELPEIEDGVVVNPCQGDWKVSGHRFGIDHEGNSFPHHTGTDVVCEDGWVRASHNGYVSYSSFLPADSALAGELWISGNTVVLVGELPSGSQICTGYGHGANLLVKEGDEVNAGVVVFKQGSTGLSSGEHLHAFIKIGGEGAFCRGGIFVNPEDIWP